MQSNFLANAPAGAALPSFLAKPVPAAISHRRPVAFCVGCSARADFFLCDASGKPLPAHRGGFCVNCAPLQDKEEEHDTCRTPAPLDVVEQVPFDHVAARIEKVVPLTLAEERLRFQIGQLRDMRDDVEADIRKCDTVSLRRLLDRLEENILELEADLYNL